MPIALPQGPSKKDIEAGLPPVDSKSEDDGSTDIPQDGSAADSNDAIVAESEQGAEVEYVPVRMELDNMRDGEVIPEDVWNPLFGNESLREGLWDRLIPDVGDEVIIKGSAVTRMFFGGYYMDPETRTVPNSLRSDIDVLYPESLAGNVERFEGKETSIAKKVDIEGLPIDLVDVNEVAHLHEQGLRELDSILSEHPDVLQSRNLLRIVRKNAEKLAVAKREDRLAETVYSMDSFMRHEGVGMKLRRIDDGSLEATVVDSDHWLDAEDLFGPTLIEQMKEQEKRGVYSGFSFLGPDPNSIYALYMGTAKIIPEVKFKERLALYSQVIAPRIAVAACEHNLELYVDPVNIKYLYFYYGFFQDIYNVMKRASEGDNIMELEPRITARSRDKGADQEKIITRIVQRSFARAAFADPSSAIDYMFRVFPMGGFISHEANELFHNYHDGNYGESLPGNVYLWRLFNSGATSETLPSFIEHDSFKAMMRIYEIHIEHYLRNADRREMTHLLNDDSFQSHSEALKINEMRNPPESMSEIFALLFVGLEWDLDKDSEKIEKALEDWKQKGELTLIWRRSESMSFDMGVDLEEVRRHMRILSEAHENYIFKEIGRQIRMRRQLLVDNKIKPELEMEFSRQLSDLRAVQENLILKEEIHQAA